MKTWSEEDDSMTDNFQEKENLIEEEEEISINVTHVNVQNSIGNI